MNVSSCTFSQRFLINVYYLFLLLLPNENTMQRVDPFKNFVNWFSKNWFKASISRYLLKRYLKISLCFFFRFLPCSLDSRISSRPRWQTYGFKNEKEEEETGERACVDVDYEETVPELADERSSAIRIPVTLGLYTRLETAITLQCCFEKPALNNYVYVLSLIWKAECFYKY